MYLSLSLSLSLYLSLSLCFFLVRSSLLITLIKCLKGHKALGSLCMSKSKTPCLSVLSDRGRYRAVSDKVWTAKKRLFYVQLMPYFVNKISVDNQQIFIADFLFQDHVEEERI